MMTKLIVLLMAIALCACLFMGCGTPVEVETTDDSTSMFVCVESTAGTTGWMIVYHKETKVMYAVTQGYYNCGSFTVLLNPDGTPMIWEGE